jgi:sterol 3beta-glucosyltransferase
MRIIVASIGSRGDVQPYINLCQGLQEAGHNVTLATNPTLCPLADTHVIKSVPVGPPVDMGFEGARLMEQSFNNMYIGLIRVMQLGSRLVEEAYPDVLKACDGADLVIVSDTGSGSAEAEKLGIPWISVTLQPGRIPLEKTDQSRLARLIWGPIGKLMISPVNRFRKRVGSTPVTDITSMQSKRMIILPVNAHVAPPDPRWPDYVRQTNYWYARPLKGWQPPTELLGFLKAGEKPVAVSLGVMSLSGKKARESAGIVLDAIRQAGVRAIIQGWDEFQAELGTSRSIFFAGSLPHSWLFDQVSAVIHHGGFGTTAAVFRAGVPAIVIPHVIDQFYWGQQVYKLGTGPKPISRGKMDVTKLKGAILQALDDVPMQEKAAEVGFAIRADPDGIKDAVSLIEKCI